MPASPLERRAARAAAYALGLAGLVSLAARAQAPDTAATLTLEQAMREALERSDSAQLLKEKQEELRQQVRWAWSNAMPVVTAGANAGEGGQPTDLSAIGLGGLFGSHGPNKDSLQDTKLHQLDPTYPAYQSQPAQAFPDVVQGSQTRYEYYIQVQQPIFTFGKVGLGVKLAEKAHHAQDLADRKARQDIQLSALDAFFQLALARSRVESAQRALARQAELTNFLERNFRMGAGQKATVLQARAVLKGFQLQLIQARKGAQVAEMGFNLVTGAPVARPVRVDTAPLPEALAATPSVDHGLAENQALESRTDLQALALQAELLEGRATLYRRNYLPNIGFQGKWGILAFKTDQLDKWDNREWQVGVGLNWTLFDGFNNAAQAGQYSSQARQLGLHLSQFRKAVSLQVQSALRDLDAADTMITAAREGLAAAQEAERLVSQNFKLGQGSLSDVLSNEQGLLDAETNYLNARYQLVRSRAALRVALGQDLIAGGKP